MFCFTFVSDHITDYIMLYSVQLKNMYSYLNSSLKLSDIVCDLSCQQSYCNLLSLYNPSNPAHEVTFPPNYVDLYEQKPKVIKSFDIRISPLLESANIKPQNIEKHFTPNSPAWCMKPPEILFDLHSGKKSESNPHMLKDDFRKMQSRYKNCQQIYTDGSKEGSKIGCAVISDNHSNMQRIPDHSSIFTAEVQLII